MVKERCLLCRKLIYKTKARATVVAFKLNQKVYKCPWSDIYWHTGGFQAWDWRNLPKRVKQILGWD